MQSHLADPARPSLSLCPEIGIFRTQRPSACSSADREEPHPQSQPSTSKSTFTCHYDGCGKSFPRAAKLSEHLNTHTGDRPFVCSHHGCSASYRSSCKLQAHEKTHLSKEEQEKLKPFVCDHEGTVNGAPCNKRFWTRQHLNRHVDGVHGLGDGIAASLSSNAKSYPCTEPGCDAVFSKRKKLREHVWAAHTDQASHDADKEEESPASLPFPCQHPGCEKKFATNAKRRAHFKTHTEARYTCALPHNGNADEVLTFANWSALQAHMREAHPPTCPYPCCNGKTFKNKNNLKLHLRRHEEKEAEALADRADTAEAAQDGDAGNVHDGYDCSGLRSFRCDWRPVGDDDERAASAPCAKTFKSLHAMKTHIRVAHLKERPFACLCGKSYGHRHLLQRHAAKCTQSASVQQEANESDGEDAIFREGGGALPESLRGEGGDSGNSTSRKRKQGHVDPDKPWERSGSKMVDLLTGALYAGPKIANEPAGNKKRRQMRGRVVSCPWPKLQSLVAQGTDEEKAVDSSAQEMQECAHCFSRVYDVRRHLESKHHVRLDDREVRALLDESEVAQLARPRTPSTS